jgi:DNA-binding CsgD family transcriptional regulator
MNERAKLDELLDALYEGVIDPHSLRRSLELTIDYMGAAGGNIHIVSKKTFKTLFFLGHGASYTEEAITAYLTHWRHRNAHRAAMRSAFASASEGVFLCHEHITEEEFQRGAYFQEFFATLGQRWLAGVLVQSDRDVEISLAFNRPLGALPFGENERKLLTELLPHLRRSIKLGMRVGCPLEEHSKAFAKSVTPAFLLDNASRIVWRNKAAEQLLQPGSALIDENGRLSSRTRNSNDMLESLIMEAIAHPGAGKHSGVIRLAGKYAPLEVEVFPASAPEGALSNTGALALVLARPIELGAPVAEILKARHRLTDAECNLAIALANGTTLEETAKRNAVSFHTVRAQLRSIFQKTGVSRQTALAALVWKAA